jgi:hypothetical protein
MTLAERIALVQQRSAATYLARTKVQMQLNQAQAHAAQLDHELIALDGELRVLQQMQAEEPS